MNQELQKTLHNTATNIRLGALEGVYNASSGHPGGSLSIAEILAYLYFKEMHIDPKNPKDPDRDRFVLSKGHCAPALYAALALRGYFPTEDLKTLRHIDSYLQGHPDMKHIPGIDMSTGSLGLGISAACGMALGAKLDAMSPLSVLRRGYSITKTEDGTVLRDASVTSPGSALTITLQSGSVHATVTKTDLPKKEN